MRVAWKVSPQDEASGWVAVKEWSGGSGQLRTEEFSVPADVWRISYSSTSGERFGIIDILVNDANDEFVTAGYGLQANDQGIMSGSFVVRRSGSFRLEISSHGLQWQVAVEQQE